MPQMIPHHSITVHRDGKNITPPTGEPFDFTADEIKEVRAHNFNALRKPINESAGKPAAQNVTDLLRGAPLPTDADSTRDTGLLSRIDAKAGEPARNQGGSLEEAKTAAGEVRSEDVRLAASEDLPRVRAKAVKAAPAPAADDDEL